MEPSGGSGASSLKPVMVAFDDYAQVCFEVERLATRVVIYMPGAPDPWSGSLVYVTPDRVSELDVTMLGAVRHLRQLGRDASWLSEHFDRDSSVSP
ncbi:hypothetical protein A11A3_12338 [Alcanivorax hongdengensis A-11-3]|uniref:Uncharacterized protein n=1 Tax=Alcanivorax hongdengensis A-11-3 TaxID=1177179 RepID=L0WCC3_9GAMM|nr:hypothetical protein [Alcanivorax hongdengensis]EKF73752.1 hypothetical protein A11A3_12338 [Alcanivorax hongdengensis A-11-3]